MEALKRVSVASGRASRRIIFTFFNLQRNVRGEKRKPKPWHPNNSPTFPQKMLNFLQLRLFLLVGLAQPLWSLATV